MEPTILQLPLRHLIILPCRNTKSIEFTYLEENLLVTDNKPYVIPDSNANIMPIIFKFNDPSDIIIIPVKDTKIFNNPPLFIFSFKNGENNMAITGPV